MLFDRIFFKKSSKTVTWIKRMDSVCCLFGVVFVNCGSFHTRLVVIDLVLLHTANCIGWKRRSIGLWRSRIDTESSSCWFSVRWQHSASCRLRAICFIGSAQLTARHHSRWRHVCSVHRICVWFRFCRYYATTDHVVLSHLLFVLAEKVEDVTCDQFMHVLLYKQSTVLFTYFSFYVVIYNIMD